MAKSLVGEKGFEFALKIIGLYMKLKKNGESVLASQLLRSGTSIGANIEEANAALSKKEFISKMSISSKEARETVYWLRLMGTAKICGLDYSDALKDAEELVRMLTAIVKTSQKNLDVKRPLN